MFQVRVGYAREFCNVTLAGYCISFYRALDGLLCSPLRKTDPRGDLWVGDQLAAVQEITVEEFVVGAGEDARQVRRTKFKLSDRGVAIERLNKMFGWNIGRSEVGRPGEFANLTDEQLDDAIMQHLIERGMSERQARALVKAGHGADGGSVRGGTQRGRVTRL